MSTPVVFCRQCGSSRPLSQNSTQFCCVSAQRAFHEEPLSENRIRSPRINGSEVSWPEAIQHIVKKITDAQSRNINSVGLYLGTSTWYRSLDWTQSILTALKLGTTSLFTDQCIDDAARLLVTEWMLGHATPLLTDLSRAHNIIILGDNPHIVGWGALQPDHDYESTIVHSQGTKQTKVAIVSSSPIESKFDSQSNIAIRPGSEAFFLLGMLHLVVNNGWYDKQYVDKYTTGLDTLQQWVKPFTVSKCAEICGVTEATISGLTLKWTRSAMGLIHLTPGALRSTNATLGAWAWMALHTLTANALRPGGIYEAIGAVDILPILVGLRTKSAPTSTVGGQPLLLMQNMGAHLLSEIENGHLDTLLLMDTPTYPQYNRLLKAIKSLPCSVVIAETENDLTRAATIVLPRTTCWEEDDIALHRNNTFSTQCVPTSNAIHPVFGDAKSVQDILSDIGNELSFKWRGSKLGIANRLLANQISKGNLKDWSQRVWGLLHEDDLILGGSMNYKGEHDRATWRPSEDQIRLAPDEMSTVFNTLKIPSYSADTLLLNTSHQDSAVSESDETIIQVHSKTGFTNGQLVLIQTDYGKIEGSIRINDTVHSQTVLCSATSNLSILDVLPQETDAWSGTPVFNGVPCVITLIEFNDV